MIPTYTASRAHIGQAQAGLDAPDSFGDRAREQDVRRMLADHLPSCEAASLMVSSCDGVVRVEGAVSDSRWLPRFKNQVTAAFPGVTIDDRLDWVVPDCGIGYA